MISNTSPRDSESSQTPLLPSIALHLLPGALATVFYILMAPVVTQMGFPPLLAIYIAILIIVAFELGYLLYQGKRKYGKLSLKGIVQYRESISVWQYVLFVPLLLVWAIIVTGLFSPIDNFLANTLFARLPDWYLFKDVPQYASLYARSTLIVTLIVGIALNGLMGPIVEELYFRGYLLPGLRHFGRWAPVINAVLFSLYHFWTPWQFVSRVLVVLSWAYVAQRKRNIYVGMITHCLLNMISVLVTFAVILR